MDVRGGAMRALYSHEEADDSSNTAATAVGKELGTASRLKPRIASIIAGDVAGRVIAAVTRNHIRHQGVWFDVGSPDFTPRVRAQLFWGIYESAETRMINTIMGGSTAVIELGSSLGITANHIASQMAPHGKLICVEANPRLIPGLHKRISAWTETLQVQVIHAAVTDRCGTTGLALAPQTFGSRLADYREASETVDVPSLTLREIVRRTGLQEFDLVSDIEGAEATFLMQDPEIMTFCRRAVIELHESTVDGKTILIADMMRAAVAAGFRVEGLHGPVVALKRR
jgi:FkbM family methyltransferase